MTALGTLAAATAEPGQPAPTWRALAHALAQAPGYILFTILLHDPAAGLIRRAYTSHPTEYPLGGSKPITPTDWTRTVLDAGRPFIGGRDAIQRVFFDHDRIASLGCGSALTLPVRWDGRTIAALSLLAAAGHYDGVDPAAFLPLAQLAIPAARG